MTPPAQASEILQAVAQLLETRAMLQRQDGADFELRVAVRLLQTLQRELSDAAAGDSAESAGMQALLDAHDGPQSIMSLRAALCAAISDGRLGLAQPGLHEHLWRTALARLAIDSPQYRWRAEPG